MKTLVIIIYKRYGAALFEGTAQLKLFSETKKNLSSSTAVQHNSRMRHKSSKYSSVKQKMTKKGKSP